ncbi:MAG: hypothetical protein JWQ81_959 [Amycolatopsis sp.]|nr:hypothetical protein [Amycolatopsis sp.]
MSHVRPATSQAPPVAVLLPVPAWRTADSATVHTMRHNGELLQRGAVHTLPPVLAVEDRLVRRLLRLVRDQDGKMAVPRLPRLAAAQARGRLRGVRPPPGSRPRSRSLPIVLAPRRHARKRQHRRGGSARPSTVLRRHVPQQRPYRESFRATKSLPRADRTLRCQPNAAESRDAMDHLRRPARQRPYNTEAVHTVRQAASQTIGFGLLPPVPALRPDYPATVPKMRLHQRLLHSRSVHTLLPFLPSDNRFLLGLPCLGNPTWQQLALRGMSLVAP